MVKKGQLISDWYLTHTAPLGSDFYKSVMDLPREEAEKLSARFRRCSPRSSYYEHRQAVESWLRQQADIHKVSIVNPNPVYFRLTPTSESGEHRDLGSKTISLPTGDVDLSCCSFTVSDSFCNHQYIETNGVDAFGADHALLGQVFNAKEIEQAVYKYNLLENLQNHQDSYIEVQMWGRPRNP